MMLAHKSIWYKWLMAWVGMMVGTNLVLAQPTLDALRAGADYTLQVLLDEQGRSRCDYHAIEGRWYPYEEAWHTGQLILGLVETYQVTGDSTYLQAARKAGDWWVSLQATEPPRLKGMLMAVHGGEVGEVINFTTVSDGTAGLFRLSEATGDPRYAQVATEAGAWMLDNLCLLDSGVCYDMVDVSTGLAIKDESHFWPDKETVTLFDVARPNTEGSLFKDMWEFTGEVRYKDAFLKLAYRLRDMQGEEGIWMDFSPNNREKGTFHPRSNLWYAESLLEAYAMTQDSSLLYAAQRTVDFYLSFQQKDGTFYRANYVDGKPPIPTSVCGSTVSFLGILMLRLQEEGVDRDYTQRIERCHDWVLANRFPSDHPDPNLRGAFINTRYRIKKGRLQLIQRDVGTAFGLRFLAAYAARG